jgi:exopolysaccharide biosynthesis polyprenyl glycosylphosphotransferase
MTPKTPSTPFPLVTPTTASVPIGEVIRESRWLTLVVLVGLMLSDILLSVAIFRLAAAIADPPNLFIAATGSLPWLIGLRLVCFRHFRLYRLHGEFHFADDMASVFKAMTLASLFGIAVVFGFNHGLLLENPGVAKLVFLLDWVIAITVFSLDRFIFRRVQMMSRHHGRNLIPTLVVGTGPEAKVCLAEISESPRLGYNVVGVLATHSTTNEEMAVGNVEDVPIIGTFSNLPALAQQLGVAEVLITDSRLPSRDVFDAMMRSGRKTRLVFRVVPGLFNCLPQKTEIHQVGSLPMIQLFEDPLSGTTRFLKRSLDILGALFGLLFLSPLFALVAFLIKRESPGPIFYAQERVGMDGRTFRMYKFRSMYADADDEVHRQLMVETICNPRRNTRGFSTKPVYGKVLNDPRLTKFGKFIRRYSIDELPNLWNVLRGEMSLVGPRPPIPYEVENYEDWHRARFNVRGGITGLWQISGRNRLNFEQMVRLDLYYIENWSIWLDLKILLRTIPVVLRGDNAY